MKKFDEVLGMITFANELISHMNQMGAAVEKEKAKRATIEQSEAEGDKLQVCLLHIIVASYKLIKIVPDASNRALHADALDKGRVGGDVA